MLSYRNRFHGHGSLSYVYKNGHAVRTGQMIMKFTPNQRRKHSRVAVVVSKKVHKSAVGRNRIRRRVYEQMRGRIDQLNSVYDIVMIVVSAEVRTMPGIELTQLVDELIDRSGICKNRP